MQDQYTYDAQDNLSTANVGSRSVTLDYNANNLLASLTQNGANVAYGYAAWGNIR